MNAPRSPASRVWFFCQLILALTGLGLHASSSAEPNGAVTTEPETLSKTAATPPKFNLTEGTYTKAQSITITSLSDRATIHYTSDGSTPSATHGTIYTGPIIVSATTTLKAITFRKDLAESPVISATYTIDPTILVHTGKHFAWYTLRSIWMAHETEISAQFDYMDSVYDQILTDWKLSDPKTKKYLWVDPKPGDGFSSGNIGQIQAVINQPAPGMGIAYDAFTGSVHDIPRFQAYAIGTRETVNLLAGSLSAGWPRDWWADHAGPFTAMTAMRVEAELGRPDVSAAYDASLDQNDSLYTLFKALQARYGWDLFDKLFAQVSVDGVKWSSIDSGYNPSSILTGYVAAYLVLAAGESLETMETSYFIPGRIPGYDHDVTSQILIARDNWKNHGGFGPAYRLGQYLSVLGYPDFQLIKLSPDALTLPPGHNATCSLTIATTQAFNGTITLSASNLPTGVTAAFTKVDANHFKVTLAADSTAPIGGSTVAILGTSGSTPVSLKHTIMFPLLVNTTASPQPVNLGPAANLYGIGNDHIILGDNGGIDGYGHAYAGSKLGPSLVWNGVPFALGIPSNGHAGTQNVVSGATILLPAGHYSALKVLGSANGGMAANQTLRVNYADGSSTLFTQSFSDWATPGKISGESVVSTQDSVDVTLSVTNPTGLLARPTYLYGYSFPLEISKNVLSFVVPGNMHPRVVVAAITLVP